MNKVSYHSKLVGVTFNGRQEVISSLTGDEELRFRREPDNEYDKNAVAVDVLLMTSETDQKKADEIHTVQEWHPIGFIAKDKNSDLAKTLDDGKEASIALSEITGGGKNSYGINVYIEHEKEKKLVRSPNAHLEKDIFGNEIFYDDVEHQYTNALGEVYISGSVYAKSFERDFPKDFISNAMAKKIGKGSGHAQMIREMWELKAHASASWGTALHAALELYGRYKQLCGEIGKTTHLHDNKVLNKAVTSFYDMYPDVDNVQYEVLVIDHLTKRAGRIDRLEDIDGELWVTDFKTDLDIKKNLEKYWRQLSFYSDIIEANGKKVKGLRVYHYDGEGWSIYEGDRVDTTV